MPRGVKKTQESEVALENNVTVSEQKSEPEKVSTAVTVEISNTGSSTEDSGKLEPEKASKPEKSEPKKSESKKQRANVAKKTESVENRFYHIERPVPLYLAKNVASPMLALVSGKCRIRSREGDWIKIIIGVPEKGSTTGYIQKFGAIIR